MDINLQAHTGVESGYGRMGVYLRRALESYGVESIGDLGVLDTASMRGNATERPDDRYVDIARVALWLSTPPHVRGWYSGQLAAIFTMWESTCIPAEFRQNLSAFDRVFVPSQQNLELFSRFNRDVRYIPLGIDSETWKPTARREVDRDFVFLTAGNGRRKGVEQVVKAFQWVFGGQDLYPVPRLIHRSQHDLYGDNIEAISTTLSLQEEIDLYESAHCFVSGSIGEGFGLMPLQAMAQACPTILGNAHGHAAFAGYGIGLDTHPVSAAEATFWGDGGEWWEPDFDQMCSAMWDVYANYSDYARTAWQLAPSIGAQFTWDNTAQQIIENLPELFEDAPADPQWQDVLPRLFKVWVNKPCKYVINGNVHEYFPGVEYDEDAHMVQRLLTNGNFDMAHFDPHDFGIDRDRVPEIATPSMCDHCHQPLIGV